MLRVYTSVRPGLRVLDVGCGRGRLAAHMAAWGLTVTGYNFSRVAIEDAQTKHSPLWEELTFVRHEFNTDPIPPDLRPNSVDVITCRHSLEFLEQTRFLTDAARWLVPGGALQVTTYVSDHQAPTAPQHGLSTARINALRDCWGRSATYGLDNEGTLIGIVLRDPQ